MSGLSLGNVCQREEALEVAAVQLSIPPITDYSTPVTAGTFVRASHRTALSEPLMQPTCMLLTVDAQADLLEILFSPIRFAEKKAVVGVCMCSVWFWIVCVMGRKSVFFCFSTFDAED